MHDCFFLSAQPLRLSSAARNGWIFVAFGVLVPFVALWGAVHGWGVREESPRAGWSLLVAGVTVFTVRLAFWLG